MKRKAFITGVNGFVGRNVARKLAHAGWHVAGSGLGPWVEGSAEDYGLERWTEQAPGDAVIGPSETPDLIVHCAGPASVAASFEQPFEAFLGTVRLTAEVLEFARLRVPSARVIFISSAAAYGTNPQALLAEDGTVDPVSPYGAYKLQAETLCRLYARHYGVTSAALRIFSVYGPGQRRLIMWDACRKLRAGKYLFDGTGDEVRDWIDVHDVATLVMAAADASLDGGFAVFNGGSGCGRTIRAFTEIIASAFGTDVRPEFSGKTRIGDPVSLVADISRARSIGWTPEISLEAGIAEYVRWYRSIEDE